MAGVLFIVIIPRSEHEKELKKSDKKPRIKIENEKFENTMKIIEELKINKKFGSIKSNIESYAQDDNAVVLSKCKSTDCLHSSDVEIVLQKSSSDYVLNDNEGGSLRDEYKNYIKESWEELKQSIKPRKRKLKISKLENLDRSTVFQMDTSLETILTDVLAKLHIQTASWSLCKNNKFWQVIFSLESGNFCEEALQVLKTFGIGSRYSSSLSVIPCTLYYNSNKEDIQNKLTELDSNVVLSKSSWSKFTSSVRARTHLAQVVQDVHRDAALTFDWLSLLIIAAFVAAIGLVENSTVILVASMLISPLMGPITAGTLGTALKDSSLKRMGLQHELFGLFLSLVIGFIFGLTICAVDERYGIGDWPTNEMMSRCEIRSLWVGALVAIPSGAGVAIAILGEYTASLVGVAISASLLPPAVNAGLLWAMSLVHLIYMDDDTRWTAVVKTSTYSNNQAVELAVLGVVSLCLTLVNIVCIFLAGVAVYKIKEVSPLEPSDILRWSSIRNSRKPPCTLDNEQAATWDFYRWCHRPEGIINSENDKSVTEEGTLNSGSEQSIEKKESSQNLQENVAINEEYANKNSNCVSDNLNLNEPKSYENTIKSEVTNHYKETETSVEFHEKMKTSLSGRISKDSLYGNDSTATSNINESESMSIDSINSVQEMSFNTVVSSYEKNSTIACIHASMHTNDNLNLRFGNGVPRLKLLSYDV